MVQTRKRIRWFSPRLLALGLCVYCISWVDPGGQSTSNAIENAPKVTQIDVSNAWKSVINIANGIISMLPNLLIAGIVFLIFLFIASAVKTAVRHVVQRRRRHRNLGLLLGQLAHIVVGILGFLIALSVIAPSFRAGDLIKMLGIGSVAIGFAFQNILQNFLAGVLLLLQEPFDLGDWINVTGLEGRVEDIQTRATVVTMRDGQRAMIPNAVIFTSPVVVGEPQTEPAQTKLSA